MSLHNNASITNFAQACANLWANWANPPLGWPGPNRRTKRRNHISQVIIANATVGFMVPPNVIFLDVGGSNGAFSWSPWRLRLKKSLTANQGLAYADYVRFCRTMYHETRHAEQFYRIAQGLAAGALKYPNKSEGEVMQELNSLSGGVGALGVGGGVGGMVQRFNVVQGGGGQIQLTAQLIANWLNIPLNVAQHGHTNLGLFNGFALGVMPAWFRRGSITRETEEWMRATYNGSLAGLNRWTQSDDGTYKMYRDQPEEHDAHEIGNRLVAALDLATGLASGVVDY